ncbi:exo-alpha-sialidase [Leucobacter sp. HY1908]
MPYRSHLRVPVKRSFKRIWAGAATAALACGLVATPLGAPAPAQAESLPAYLTDPTASPGTFTSENIAGDRTSEQFFYRIPALAYLGEGVVVAAWDARPGSAADAPNPNSIMVRRSTDNGKTWGEYQLAAEGHVGDASQKKYGYSDPSFIYDAEAGKLFASFVYSLDQGFHGSGYGNDPEDRSVIGSAVIESADGGETWSEPKIITEDIKTSNGTVVDGKYQPAEGDVKSHFATSGEGIQLKYGEHKGRLVQQHAGRIRQADGSEPIQAWSVYSDDHGETWQRGAATGTTMDENKVVELSDGTLMMNSRDSSGGGRRLVAYSNDGGATWGPVQREEQLPDPTNNGAITRVNPDAAEGSADAQKLLFTNSNSTTARANGAARVSCDDGKTWPGLRQLTNGSSFHYSTVTRIDEGKFGVLWERNYTSDLPFSTFDDEWLNYVCAPLAVGSANLEPGVETQVLVTVTNQEQEPLTGIVSFADQAGWTFASDGTVTALAPGESVEVPVSVTAPAEARNTQHLTAMFTAADGRLSQAAVKAELPRQSTLGLKYELTNTSPARNLAENPYAAGDTLSFTVRVTSTSNVQTTATPGEANFTTGFAPTACRFQRLGAGAAYNCGTPKVTLTEADIERGSFTPNFAFTLADLEGDAADISVPFTGATVPLADGALSLEVSGERNDAGRDLAANPYVAGDQVPYQFTVTNTSSVTAAVVPTAGNFKPFVPADGAGNCRYSVLNAGQSYPCATPLHEVTSEEAERGFFLPLTTWEMSAGGQTTLQLDVTGDEVDLVKRAPALSLVTTGKLVDNDGDGYASVGDELRFATAITNAGNVRVDDVQLIATQAARSGGASLAPGESLTAEHDAVVLDDTLLVEDSFTYPAVQALATNGLIEVASEADASTLELVRAPVIEKPGTGNPDPEKPGKPGTGNSDTDAPNGDQQGAADKPAMGDDQLVATGATSNFMLLAAGLVAAVAGAVLLVAHRMRKTRASRL